MFSIKFFSSRTFVLFVFSACLTSAASAADWLLATAQPQVTPGQPFSVTVIGANLPDTLPAQIDRSHGIPLSIQLQATAPATGERRPYTALWPREVASGVRRLRLNGAPSAQLLFDAGTAPTLLVAEPVHTPSQAGDRILPQAVAEKETPPNPPSLGFNEPIYFLVGGSPLTARFQLSFKYRLFDANSVVVEHLPFLGGLHFGYTQTSLWDLDSDSKPFIDTSFRPSLFYEWSVPDLTERTSLALRAGLEHESNGKDGAKSRSINILFAQMDSRHYAQDGVTYFGLTPKVWAYLDKDDNPDIQHYRGYGELGLRYGRDDGWLLATNLRMGTKGKGSAQFDLSYPLKRSIFSDVGAFVHLQYFRGYGETMLNYNRSSNGEFRVGLSLVR